MNENQFKNKGYETAIVIKEDFNHVFNLGEEVDLIGFKEYAKGEYFYTFIRWSDQKVCDLEPYHFAFIENNLHPSERIVKRKFGQQ